MLRKLVAAIIIAAASLSSAFALDGETWKTYYPEAKPGYGCYAYVNYPETMLKTKVTNGYISMVLSVKRYMPKGSVSINVGSGKYRMHVKKHKFDGEFTDVMLSSKSVDLYWALIKSSSMIVDTADNSYIFGLSGSAKALRTCLKGPEPRKTYASPHKAAPGTMRLVKLDGNSNDGEAMYMLKGRIDMYADKRLKSMINGIPYGSRVFLNSKGGSIYAAGMLGRMLEDRGIKTAVYTTDRCASACAIIFAYGIDRLVWKGSKIGLHRISYKGTSGVSRDVAASNVQEVAGILIGLFDRKGIDSEVLAHMLKTPAESMYWMPHNEARRFGLATVVVDGEEG